MAKPLDRHGRKALLKRGQVTSIAKRTKRTPGHVSQVIAGLRRDAVVEKEVARRFKMKPADAFGPVEDAER